MKKAALEPLKQLKELMKRQLNYEQSLNMEVIEESEPLPDLAPEPALVPEPSDPADDAEPSDPEEMLTSDLDNKYDSTIDELVLNNSISDELLPELGGPSTSADVTHFRAGSPNPIHHV